MLNAVVIRDYCGSDFDTLWKIDQVCFEPGISYSRRELGSYIARMRAFTLVAERKGKILGFVVVDRNRRNQGHVVTIDVLPEARRSGLGSLLLSTAEGRLRTIGSSVVLLETAVDNLAALEFYKRHGYTAVDIIPQYYLGNVDALVLAKDLSTTEG